MGTRISSEKMVSNAQRRINDGPNNAEMPLMRDHILSRQKAVGDDELVATSVAAAGSSPSTISPPNRVRTGLERSPD